MTRILVTTLTAAALVTGCSFVNPPIRLDGRASEVQALAGEWSGDGYTRPLADATGHWRVTRR